eukprot:s860_g2.t1
MARCGCIGYICITWFLAVCCQAAVAERATTTLGLQTNLLALVSCEVPRSSESTDVGWAVKCKSCKPTESDPIDAPILEFRSTDAAESQFPTGRVFYVPGSYVDGGTLETGSGAVHLLPSARRGDFLALSVHPGCLALLKAEVKNQGVELELGLADRFAGLEVQASSDEWCPLEDGDPYETKFPQMHRFEVKGPGVCTQNFVDSISPATWPTNFGDPKNLVPDAGSTTLFRADVATMTQVQELSVGSSFSSGFADRDGAYVYLVPDSSGYAFKRVATSTFDATETASLAQTSGSFMGGFVAGEFVYVMPGTFAHGVINRVDIEGFSTISELDLKSVEP